MLPPSPRRSPADDARGELIDASELITYQRLAMRVIQRAFKDLMSGSAADDRESAREFLSGSPMLFHWCSVAALDPRRVMAQAAIESLRRPSVPTVPAAAS